MDESPHYYFIQLNKSCFLDETKMGNASRYINHSCSPNCVTQKWNVGSEIRLGLFALRNIEKYEELTYDYNYGKTGNKLKKCLCGSENCRVFLSFSKKEAQKYKNNIENNDIEMKTEMLTEKNNINEAKNKDSNINITNDENNNDKQIQITKHTNNKSIFILIIYRHCCVCVSISYIYI